MLQNVRDERNGHGHALENLCNRRLKRHSVARKWTPVTYNDIRASIVIMQCVGLVNKPRLSDYWSVKLVIQTVSAPLMMPRDKFVCKAVHQPPVIPF